MNRNRLPKRRRPARCLAAIGATAALVFASTPAQAMDYVDWGMASCTWMFYRGNYNSTWTVPMVAAEPRWNVVPEVDIYRSSGTAGTSGSVYAAQYPDDWYGYATVTGNTSFVINLNSRTIPPAATNLSNFIQSTYVHEFGHTLMLANDPTTSSSSIMKYSRNRNTMVTPQTYDKTNVSDWY